MRDLMRLVGKAYRRLGQLFYIENEANAHYAASKDIIKKQIHQLRLAATCEMVGARMSYPVQASGAVPCYGTDYRANVLFAVADDLERSLLRI